MDARAGCGSSSRPPRRRRPSTTRTRPSSAEGGEGGDGVLGLGRVEAPVVDHERPCPRRPGRTAPSAGPGAPSSWGCAGGSCGAWGRGPRRRPASAATRIEPWRARPVPFWRHGLAPPPRTSARVLVVWVPDRRAASWAVTTWCITGTLGSMPKMASSSSTVPAFVAGWRLRRRPWPSHRLPFTASRMSTRPPLGPGTAPFTSSRSRSASASTTSRFSVVTLLAAHAAGHAGALEHAGRRGAGADGARGPVDAVGAVAGAAGR